MPRTFCASALTSLLALTGPAKAAEPFTFVEANILGIFYHELGHAAVHTEELPIFGQEEDAADVFSIFMIDALFEEDTAQSLAIAAVLGFEGEAIMRDMEDEEIAWWDTHGPDEQRTYNTACLFYGASPETREAFAKDVDLPEERAESCPEEYDQAAMSWGAVLDIMGEIDGRPRMSFRGAASLASTVIEEEIRHLNDQLRLAEPVEVVVEACDEPNAFYDPEAYRITFCTEFVDHLQQMEALLAQQ